MGSGGGGDTTPPQILAIVLLLIVSFLFYLEVTGKLATVMLAITKGPDSNGQVRIATATPTASNLIASESPIAAYQQFNPVNTAMGLTGINGQVGASGAQNTANLNSAIQTGLSATGPIGAGIAAALSIFKIKL